MLQQPKSLIQHPPTHFLRHELLSIFLNNIYGHALFIYFFTRKQILRDRAHIKLLIFLNPIESTTIESLIRYSTMLNIGNKGTIP